jgi:hypothetical protein
MIGNKRFLIDNTNIGTATDVPSAMFELSSTSQGFLPSRMTTTQKNAIASPATGLVVYDTTLGGLSVYNGTIWTTVTASSPSVVDSSATVGGAATEAVTVAGLLTTSTIWAVTQGTKGGANLPLLGWTNTTNGSLNIIYSADMGPGAVVRVVFIP